MRERVWIMRRMARKRQSPARACPVATRSSYSGETKKLEKVSLGWLLCSCPRLGDSRESCHLLSLLRNALYDMCRRRAASFWFHPVCSNIARTTFFSTSSAARLPISCRDAGLWTNACLVLPRNSETMSPSGRMSCRFTPLVPLSAKGDARFRGDIGPLSFACVSEPNLAFLIRTAGGAWIANGAIRLSGGRE